MLPISIQEEYDIRSNPRILSGQIPAQLDPIAPSRFEGQYLTPTSHAL